MRTAEPACGGRRSALSGRRVQSNGSFRRAAVKDFALRILQDDSHCGFGSGDHVIRMLGILYRNAMCDQGRHI